MTAVVVSIALLVGVAGLFVGLSAHIRITALQRDVYVQRQTDIVTIAEHLEGDARPVPIPPRQSARPVKHRPS